MKTDRIAREKKVVSIMITAYCRAHHEWNKDTLCEECNTLHEYALSRLDHCPKGISKSSCRKCEIHCYAPAYRTKIRTVMRYMGPRMLLISPISAMRHLWDELY